MKDGDIDDLFERAGGEVDPAVIERISREIGSSLTPVRARRPAWMETAVLALCGAAWAAAGAAHLGFYGVTNMGTARIAILFPAIGGLLCLLAAASVREAIPGSRRPAAPWQLLVAAVAALALLFAALFREPLSGHLVSQGVTCLKAGLVQAVPAALTAWLLLRGGFVVNPVAAGLVQGTLAGAVGVTMLELHCNNFETLHVVVWHTAVIPVSGAVGALLGWWKEKRGPEGPLGVTSTDSRRA